MHYVNLRSSCRNSPGEALHIGESGVALYIGESGVALHIGEAAWLFTLVKATWLNNVPFLRSRKLQTHRHTHGVRSLIVFCIGCALLILVFYYFVLVKYCWVRDLRWLGSSNYTLYLCALAWIFKHLQRCFMKC